MRGLGSNSLPREWYVIPANIHLNKWTSGTNTWPVTSSQEVALLNLYRTVLAEYQRGGGSVNTFQPCHFEASVASGYSSLSGAQQAACIPAPGLHAMNYPGCFKLGKKSLRRAIAIAYLCYHVASHVQLVESRI